MVVLESHYVYFGGIFCGTNIFQIFTYSFELKMQAVEFYYSEYSRTEMAEMLTVKHKRKINEGVNKYEKWGEEGLRDQHGNKKGMGKGRPVKRPYLHSNRSQYGIYTTHVSQRQLVGQCVYRKLLRTSEM